MQTAGEVAVMCELEPSHTGEISSQNSCDRERAEAGGDGDGRRRWPAIDGRPASCWLDLAAAADAETGSGNRAHETLTLASCSISANYGSLAWIEVDGF